MKGKLRKSTVLSSALLAFNCLAAEVPVTNVIVWGDGGLACGVPLDLTNAIYIASGEHHGLAVRADGRVASWGWNGLGELDLPVDLTNAVTVSAGEYFSILLRADGTVVASSGSGMYVDLTNVTAIAAGRYHALALKGDGTVAAWGENSDNQCYVPPELSNVVAVAGGQTHSLALKADGSVVQWGAGTDSEYYVPPPPSLTNAIAIGAGTAYSVALKSDGTLVGWGVPWFADLLDKTNLIAIAAGQSHVLAISRDGTVFASGRNDFGQCSVPPGLPPVRQVTASWGNFSMALVDMAYKIPPKFGSVPLSRTVSSGSSATFNVSVFGSPVLHYQWFFGTNAITGATSGSLTLNDLRCAQSGEYSVVVTNESGSATATFNLSVLTSLQIDMVPAITLNGDAGSTYRLDYVSAVGPTNDWQTIANVHLTSNVQFYFDSSAIGQPKRFYRLTAVP